MPRNSQAVVGMPSIETLDALTVDCNSIDVQTQSEHTNSEMEDKCQHTSNTQETGSHDKCNRNTTSILNSNNGHKPMITDNINGKISYFIPSPKQEADKGKCRNHTAIT